MKAFYFPEMPVGAVEPAVVRLGKPPAIMNYRQVWETRYGGSVLLSLKEHGQLNPCIISRYPGHWFVEPGQTRLFAMRELGWPTYKAIVREDDVEHPFQDMCHRELPDLDAVLELYKSGDIIRNDQDREWFRDWFA